MEQQTECDDEIQSGEDEWEHSNEESGCVSKSQRICRTMCVTSNTGIMILLWTIATMLFSGNSFYWFVSTAPYFQYQDQALTILYPLSAVTGFVLVLYPVLALLGDYFPRNLWLMVIVVVTLNMIGIAITFAVVASVGNPYLTLTLGYGLMLLANAVFQANIIQYARDAIPSQTSHKFSTFLHWYYWATYTPCVLLSIWFGAYQLDVQSIIRVVDFLAMPVIGLLIVIALLVTCIIRQCSEGCRITPRHMHDGPIRQIGQITWVALRRKSHPALSRLDRAKQSNGGPYTDERVNEVKHFCHVFFFLASMFGFFFWDDTRSTTFIHSVIYNDPPVFMKPSSQVITATIIFLAIPIYQILIRPFLHNHLPSATVRIMLGLLMEFVTSLLLVGFNWWMEADIESNSALNVSLCTLTTNNTLYINATTMNHPTPKTVSFPLIYIPQVTNAFSQMLVFIGVLELILTRAPRKMHGVLIGFWYAMQSIRPIVRVIELASCAVYYWEYYVLKAAIVLSSIITYMIAVIFCSHQRHTIKYQLLMDTTEI